MSRKLNFKYLLEAITDDTLSSVQALNAYCDVCVQRSVLESTYFGTLRALRQRGHHETLHQCQQN